MRDLLIVGSAILFTVLYFGALLLYKPKPPPTRRQRQVSELTVAFQGIGEAMRGMEPAFRRASRGFVHFARASERGPRA